MCLAVPGKIVEIYHAGELKMGKLDFGGVTREVCLAYVPEADLGQYAIVHVGFAISILNEEEALQSLAVLKELTDLEAQLGIGYSQME